MPRKDADPVFGAGSAAAGGSPDAARGSGGLAFDPDEVRRSMRSGEGSNRFKESPIAKKFESLGAPLKSIISNPELQLTALSVIGIAAINVALRTYTGQNLDTIEAGVLGAVGSISRSIIMEKFHSSGKTKADVAKTIFYTAAIAAVSSGAAAYMRGSSGDPSIDNPVIEDVISHAFSQLKTGLAIGAVTGGLNEVRSFIMDKYRGKEYSLARGAKNVMAGAALGGAFASLGDGWKAMTGLLSGEHGTRLQNNAILASVSGVGFSALGAVVEGGVRQKGYKGALKGGLIGGVAGLAIGIGLGEGLHHNLSGVSADIKPGSATAVLSPGSSEAAKPAATAIPTQQVIEVASPSPAIASQSPDVLSSPSPVAVSATASPTISPDAASDVEARKAALIKAGVRVLGDTTLGLGAGAGTAYALKNKGANAMVGGGLLAGAAGLALGEVGYRIVDNALSNGGSGSEIPAGFSGSPGSASEVDGGSGELLDRPSQVDPANVDPAKNVPPATAAPPAAEPAPSAQPAPPTAEPKAPAKATTVPTQVPTQVPVPLPTETPQAEPVRTPIPGRPNFEPEKPRPIGSLHKSQQIAQLLAGNQESAVSTELGLENEELMSLKAAPTIDERLTDLRDINAQAYADSVKASDYAKKLDEVLKDPNNLEKRNPFDAGLPTVTEGGVIAAERDAVFRKYEAALASKALMEEGNRLRTPTVLTDLNNAATGEQKQAAGAKAYVEFLQKNFDEGKPGPNGNPITENDIAQANLEAQRQEYESQSAVRNLAIVKEPSKFGPSPGGLILPEERFGQPNFFDQQITIKPGSSFWDSWNIRPEYFVDQEADGWVNPENGVTQEAVVKDMIVKFARENRTPLPTSGSFNLKDLNLTDEQKDAVRKALGTRSATQYIGGGAMKAFQSALKKAA